MLGGKEEHIVPGTNSSSTDIVQFPLAPVTSDDYSCAQGVRDVNGLVARLNKNSAALDNQTEYQNNIPQATAAATTMILNNNQAERSRSQSE